MMEIIFDIKRRSEKGDSSTVLMIQEQLFVSKLFKDIQELLPTYYHIGCAFNLHSIINSGLTLGGQNFSKRQTVFFQLFEPRDKIQKDPDKIDLNVPRREQILANAWTRHQDAEYWIDINLFY